jgi:two-component system chemotaxis response regulator CheY
VSWPRRVLVVDDEPSVRRSCERILQESGVEVESVTTADDAFPLLARGDFDAVLLDMMMPGMHGVEALAEIKRLWPGLSVIVITGYATLDMQRECLDAGAAAWLGKPFGPDELMAAIERARRE